ncbi:MAG: LPXTG cell wall anchor domain-containing protein [Firmicutes bacterium]|uniref:LPXTG-motif cell wall anchor domain-containing protein/PEP-CTERM protein-sorting domain-containing protein n=1 Tax=Melghirimyces thermohalophilus TaxID=1236220 RepID=A0A1G6PUP4_9BACL|nr:EYxxD motif small membrane protein [Melghirimyces thermohalophilus]MDA8351639.1 LPXTG cell wall anchor domain-containing protein [Bacillota bacterium]SDC83246.1 LPXTG-motif cell wall anchor domain-containing protein/PEP-CTERM protein-sorting domain-containing protein [Melghirimyces thermohalophilus]
MNGWLLIGDQFNDYSYVIATVVGSLLVIGFMIFYVRRRRKAG